MYVGALPVAEEVSEDVELDRLKPERRTGQESFHAGGTELGFSLSDFWRWSASDLVSNTLRGVVAEFLVAQALGVAEGVRLEWDAVDLRTSQGTALEVKASGYLQSWRQDRLSTPSFDIRQKKSWDAITNSSARTPARAAQIYVFALHQHQAKATVDPLDVDQWAFYVIPTSRINSQFGTMARLRLGA